MKKIKTLRRAFFKAILPLTALFTFSFFLLIQWIQIKESYDLLNNKLDHILWKQSEDLSYPLWIVNYERLEELSRALFYDGDISGVNVFDEKNSIITSFGSTKGYSRETMDFLTRKTGSYKVSFRDFGGLLLSALGVRELSEKKISSGIDLQYKSGGSTIPVGSVYITLTDMETRIIYKRQIRLYMILFILIFSLISLSISLAYYKTVQLPLKSIRAFIHDKEQRGFFQEELPKEDRNNDLTYIRKRFERIWNKQDELLKEQHNSKEYYRNLLNSLPMGIVLADREGHILESNFSFQILSGYSEKEIRLLYLEDFTPVEHREKEKMYLEELMNEGFHKPYEKTIITREGKETPVRVNGSTVNWGEEKRTIKIFENISEKIDIETELNRSYRFLDTTSQIARVGGWELDLKSNRLNWTGEVFRIHELEEDFRPDLKKIYHFFGKEYGNIIKTAMDRAITQGIPFEFEARLITNRGREKWVLFKGQPRYEDGVLKTVHGTLQDITDRKNSEEEYHRLQDELGHKSRLDILGQLASGVAHDFNNILSGIISSAEILKYKLKDSQEDYSKYTDIIIQQSENASMLSRRLLALSRKGNYIKTAVNLNRLLEDTVTLMKNLLDKKISISLKMNGESFVNVDYSSIQNAIMNICINSSHAMPDGGKLSIEKITEENIKGDLYEKIVITDTGTGIGEENLSKIFEPFFTTKKEGEGTGLGLSAVKRTLEDHGGSVSVASVEGEGTSMILMLPANSEGTAVDMEEKNLVFGKGNILLVDDEEINRETGKEILETLGYTISLASNGYEAVEYYRENRERIDLIILDMVMPVMDGYEAFGKIREIDRSARILILTGYADHKKLELLKEKGVEGIIKKPFQIPRISQILSKLLPLSIYFAK